MDRSLLKSIVGTTDSMVLHRPFEPAELIRQVATGSQVGTARAQLRLLLLTVPWAFPLSQSDCVRGCLTYDGEKLGAHMRWMRNNKMNSRVFWKLPSVGLCFALFWMVLPTHAQQAHPPHWSYEGKEGPQNWGQLDPAYATCASGHAQSPIDIADAKLAELLPLEFQYNSATLNIINNGHTIQVNYAPGSRLTVGDKTYTLKQFHFHHPSEERINGRDFDLVAHLVHDDGSGHLAVVAVLFKQGKSNPLLDAVWRNIPPHMERAVDMPSVRINVTDLLPGDTSYYTYRGSLTTPPCSEGVTWYVLKNMSTLSADQVAAFAKLYPHNARPIQPRYDREILATK